MKSILLIFLLISGAIGSFAQADELVTLRPFHIGWLPTGKDSLLTTMFQSRSHAPEGGIALNDSWRWELGAADEGLEEGVVNGEMRMITDLPHRILQPNRSIWYKRVVSFDQPGRLIINADDGAQLFVNGVSVKRISGNVFSVPALSNAIVTVRVLNNAMAGGLRQVRWMSEPAWQQWELKEQWRQRSVALARKQLLIGLPQAKVLVEKAISKPTKINIEAAEAAYQNHPLLVGPWITRGDNSEAWISALADTQHPVDIFIGQDSLHLKHFARQQGEVVHFGINDWAEKSFAYQLVSGKVKTRVYSVTNSQDATWQFSVWADSQSGWPVFAKHLQGTQWRQDAFTVGVGDLVGNGSDADEWNHFFGLLGGYAATHPAYLVPGNHDYDGYADDLQPDLFQQRVPRKPANYFSWYRGNCAFVALDPNQHFPIAVPKTSDQYHWLQQEFQSPAWKNATWRFVFVHQTLYSQGWAGYEGDQALRDLLEPLLERARIDFVVSGHTHDYERLTRKYGKQEVTFFVVGGAGGELEPEASSPAPVMDRLEKTFHIARVKVDRNVIQWQAVDLLGNIIDQISFSK